jgi:hypothetical protein
MHRRARASGAAGDDDVCDTGPGSDDDVCNAGAADDHDGRAHTLSV